MHEGFSIGRRAALTGLPVKTIRFYSDAGLLPPSGRTEAGHRRYTATDVARLQLVRTLRDLDVALDTVGRLLAGRRELSELLAAHVAALEARDQALHRQLAVVRAAAASPTPATLRRVHVLSRLEAAERGRLLDRFWDRVTEGLPGSDPRAAAAVEPMARGFAELLGRRDGPVFRRWLVTQLDAHTDPRAERYWELVGILQGRPDGEFVARVTDHAWLIDVLRHHGGRPRAPAPQAP
jgi:DNA-binding transcriptional MerR regulator